jgi:hypothetical protein
MIYFLVTTSLFNDCNIRKAQYINGISTLINIIEKKNIENYKVIIIENNGERHTILNELGEVFYTNNNSLPKINRGYKELQDIFDCINHYKINDDDFIVKITGRYILHSNSEFMEAIKNYNYDCIIKYGNFCSPVNYKMGECITGLIGMRTKYVKQIELPEEELNVECNWAKIANTIENIHMVDKLGIYMCPASNNYFFI